MNTLRCATWFIVRLSLMLLLISSVTFACSETDDETSSAPEPLSLHPLRPPPPAPPTPVLRIKDREGRVTAEQPGTLIHVDWFVGDVRQRRDPGDDVTWPPLIRVTEGSIAIALDDVVAPEVGFVRVYTQLGARGVPDGKPIFECRVKYAVGSPGCELDATGDSWEIQASLPDDNRYFIALWATWLIPGEQDRYSAAWIFALVRDEAS